MSDAPLVLGDDDFAEDAPPGFLSQKRKDQFVVWMILVLVISFLAQMILPVIISFASMPFLMMNSMQGGLSQYSRMTAWRGALWYPVLDIPGGGHGGCQLRSLDYNGKPVETPAIPIDTQPEWLFADGDRLWAVAKNEVAEVLPDGTRPVVMFPTRYLENPSAPFLYEGKLAVVDEVQQKAGLGLFTFENGEWQQQVLLGINNRGPVLPTAAAIDPEMPADALFPENTNPSWATYDSLRAAGMAQLTSARMNIVFAGGDYHVVVYQGGVLYHHVGLPLKSDQNTATGESNWLKIDLGGPVPTPSKLGTTLQPELFSLTVVADAPAIFLTSSQKNSTELWRWTDGKWQASSVKQGSGTGTTSLTTFRLPDTDRTFAVVDKFGGMSQELFELQPDRIEKIKSLGGPMVFANPLSTGYLKMQITTNLSVYVPLILQVLLMTWLLRTHRDPNYYKGRTAVQHASLIMRILAMLVDAVIVYVPLGVIWAVWYQSLDQDLFDLFQTFFEDPKPVLLAFIAPMTASGICILVWGLVCWLMTAWLGCTPGKFLCGVRVVKTNLEVPGLLKALIRMILWGVETGIMNGIIAFACIAFTLNRQRVADLVAGTVVVNAKSLRHARQHAG